jgi:hypothetical protein
VFGSDFLRQIERKAIGILERKCIIAGNDRTAAGAHPFNNAVQNAHSPRKGAQELAFFQIDRFQDKIGAFAQFGIDRAHLFDHCRDDLRQEWLLEADRATLVDCAAQNAA